MDAATGHFGVAVTAPQVILFSSDVERAITFYRRLDFNETFRVPDEGPPVHADLVLGDYKIGFASIASSRAAARTEARRLSCRFRPAPNVDGVIGSGWRTPR